MKKQNGRTEKSFAVSGIFLMIMSLFAFSFVIGESSFVNGEQIGRNFYCYDETGKSTKIPGISCSDFGLLETRPVQEVNTLSSLSTPVSVATTLGATVKTAGASVSTTGSTLTGKVLRGVTLGSNGEIGQQIETYVKSASETKITGIDIQTGKEVLLEPATNTKFDLNNLQSLGQGNIEVYDVGAGRLASLSSEQLNKLGIKSAETLSNGNIEIITEAGTKSIYDASGNLVSSSKVSTFGPLTGGLAVLAENLAWAVGVIGAIQLLGPMLGLDEGQTSALSYGAGLGFATRGALLGAAEEGLFGESFTSLITQEYWGISVGTWAGIGVGLISFILLYSSTETKVVRFECLPWDAPTGGEDCEKCNEQGDLPCSEYQCRSLGQACEIVNEGTEEQKCVWVNREDVNPPTIEPLESALLEDYIYTPDNAISPPDRGVKINYQNSNDNCIPAFTPMQFGVELDEPAKCKIDILRKENFDDMSFFMSSGLLRYNHTYALSLPSAESLKEQNITVENDGNYELYVRCQDANGNHNTGNFVFKYCVDEGPDTTPPVIVTTSINTESPVSYNQSTIELDAYVNEPAQCRWSHNDKDYDQMENQFSCSTNVLDYNAKLLYKCATTLTGLKDNAENDFYFRCKDKPNSPENERNTNAESYEFSLTGTKPIVIDELEPDNETIKDATDSVKVTLTATTVAGYNEGESTCYYSETGEESDYLMFFYESGLDNLAREHSQDLFLPEGDYNYFVKCIDLGGNYDVGNVSFEVETDTTAPLVVRAFKEEGNLKLITDDEGECVYSTFDCTYDFDEGTSFTTIEGTSHFSDWNSKSNYYVKCRDDFGNEPLPNQCSITLRASDFI